MSYEFYKIVHLTSVAALFLSLGLFFMPLQKHFKKTVFSLHGAAVAALLISGFGLIAKTGISLQFKNHVTLDIYGGLLFLAVLVAVKVFFRKNMNYKLSKWSKPLLIFAVFYTLTLVFSVLQPQWISQKLLVWVTFALGVPLLKIRKFKDQHTIFWSFLYIFTAFYAIWHAVYKIS